MQRGRSSEAGFTLVESLVALAVVASVLASIGGLAFTTMRSSLFVQSHLADVNVARVVMTGLPKRDALTGTLSGDVDRYHWRLDASPYAARDEDPRGQSQWAPQLIAMRVAGPNGSFLNVWTVRLRHKAAQ